MILLQRYRKQFADYLLADQHNRFLIIIFCKSLYVFLLLKIIFLWPVLQEIIAYSAPLGLGRTSLGIFLIVMLISLVAGLILKINYVLSLFIFLSSFLLSRLAQPVVNGSDLVLNLFLFLSIFLAAKPEFKSAALKDLQQIISNSALLFGRIQLSLIYFLSGFDKLTSDAWRSGEAVFSIINLEFFFNPILSVSGSEIICLVLAWVIILFELAFTFLIWVKKLRVPLLIMGVIFHLVIIFLLSLPDFGIVMILTYSLFIPFPKK